MLEIFTVAFFGHRYIDNPLRVEELLEEQIRKLIDENKYVEFLVGRNGDFDRCISSTVLRVRKNYRNDNSYLVLMLPYATAEYLNNQKYTIPMLKYPIRHQSHTLNLQYKFAIVKW